jgi:hypothetical protein
MGDAVTDEELTSLALAADPDAQLDADAVSFWAVAGPDAGREATDQLLPEWYMPPMTGRRLAPARRTADHRGVPGHRRLRPLQHVRLGVVRLDRLSASYGSRSSSP